MTITSSNLTAGAAIGGQGGSGQGRKARVTGLVATAVVGIGLLTGVVLGRAHQAAAPAGGQGALPGAPAVSAGYQSRSRFLEWNLDLPTAGAARPSGIASQRLLEWNTQLPTADTLAVVPDQFTYREDHRAITVDTFVPDQFAYREDHR